MNKATKSEPLTPAKVYENMKKNDKFIGDVLAPFEEALGIKFNKFDKPEDPKYVEPKRKANLKLKLKKAERKQQKNSNLTPEEKKKVQWKAAIDKANGIKDKEDPKIIKKIIKRKEVDKKRHKKKWAERLEKQQEAKSIQAKRKKERIEKSRSKKRKGKK